MDLLQRPIKGDWFELRQLPLQYFAVRDHLQLTDEAVAALAAELRSGSHQHLAALKRERLAPVFFAVDEGKYQTLTTEQISGLAAVTREVLFLVMLQRVAVRAAKAAAGPDQRQRLQASFAQNFDGIFATIRRHYSQMISEAVAASQEADSAPTLRRADLSPLEPVLTR